MAYSGSGNGVVRSTGKPLPASFVAAHTACAFVKSSSAPSTSSGFDVVYGTVGGSGQNPQANMHWDHTAAAFYKSWSRRASGGTYYVAQYASSLPVGTWFHMLATYDGSISRVYFDGVLDGTSNAGAPGSSASCYASLMGAVTSSGAYDNSPTSFPNGQVAEAGFWDTVLTADEIVSLVKGFRPSRVRPDKLQAYFPAVRDIIEIRKGGASVVSGSMAFADHPRVFG